jgi:hypothetical protein
MFLRVNAKNFHYRYFCVSLLLWIRSPSGRFRCRLILRILGLNSWIKNRNVTTPFDNRAQRAGIWIQASIVLYFQRTECDAFHTDFVSFVKCITCPIWQESGHIGLAVNKIYVFGKNDLNASGIISPFNILLLSHLWSSYFYQSGTNWEVWPSVDIEFQ